MSIAFEELAGSPRLRIDERGTTATREFRVAWSDWPAFVEELVGSYTRVGCGYAFRRPLAFPDLADLIVAGVEVAPFDGAAPDGGVTTLEAATNAYPAAGAKVTATYKSLYDGANQPRSDLPSVPDTTFLLYSAELGSESLATPGRLWLWDASPSEPLPPDRGPATVVPTGMFRLTWLRVAAPPWDAIRALRGKVNDTPFVGAAAETVLFVGAKVSREFQLLRAGGHWRLEYQFAERSLALHAGGTGGWNHLYRKSDWTRIKDAAGHTPYTRADFAPLFQFGAC